MKLVLPELFPPAGGERPFPDHHPASTQSLGPPAARTRRLAGKPPPRAQGPHGFAHSTQHPGPANRALGWGRGLGALGVTSLKLEGGRAGGSGGAPRTEGPSPLGSGPRARVACGTRPLGRPAAGPGWKPLTLGLGDRGNASKLSPIGQGPQAPGLLAGSVSSVPQSCPTLCDPMDCSTPGFAVHHQLPVYSNSCPSSW